MQPGQSRPLFLEVSLPQPQDMRKALQEGNCLSRRWFKEQKIGDEPPWSYKSDFFLNWYSKPETWLTWWACARLLRRRIELDNIRSEDTLKTGTFIIGGLLFIKSVPGLLSNIFRAFKGDIAGIEFSDRENMNP